MADIKKIPVLYHDKQECCGCTACCSVCPKQAITMETDTEGYLYPRVDERKCVCCYCCLRVCPIGEKSNNSVLN